MRPRVFPAEDRPAGDHPRAERSASMRPRVFPAEDANEAIKALESYRELQ